MWCGIDAKITSVNVTQIMNMNFYKKNMTANLYFLGRTKAVSLRVSFWSELSVKFIPRLHEQKLVPVWRTNQNNQNNNYGVHWIIPNTTSMRQQSSKSCQFRPEKRSHKAFTFHIDMRISIRYSYRDELWHEILYRYHVNEYRILTENRDELAPVSWKFLLVWSNVKTKWNHIKVKRTIDWVLKHVTSENTAGKWPLSASTPMANAGKRRSSKHETDVDGGHRKINKVAMGFVFSCKL